MFSPTEHPLLPVPGVEEVELALRDEAVAAEMLEFLRAREERIAQAEADPFRFGFDLPHWEEADRLLEWIELILFVFGGNRSGKSEYAAKRVMQTAVEYPDSILMCLHESEDSSIETQQKLIWKYLPPELKALNEKRNPVYKIRYSQAGGFTEGKLVLPNRSEIHFVSYKQDPGAFEGWELGVRAGRANAADAAGKAANPWAGIGAWADENMPLPWVKMLLFRLASRAGKLLWTFTPVNGMTPTIKDLVGKNPKTLQSRFAELLADRVNVAGLPVGHMPFIQAPERVEKSRVIYFFSQYNPFGQHYGQIKKLCAGRPSGFTEIRAYGYCRDSVSRAFPNFGEVNIVEPEHLPAVGTNYMVTDPAGSRNWATVWARVAPGNPARIYIYRDWPDVRRFGEWAVTASNPRLFDGEPGPAQVGLGYGVPQYKQLWLAEERISGDRVERDPYRVRGLEVVTQRAPRTQSAQRTDGERVGRVNAGDYVVEQVDGRVVVRERVFERYIDPRAGRNQHIAERGGTCVQDLMAETQREPGSGRVLAGPMYFALGSGVHIHEGVTRLNELMWWDRDQPLVDGVNAPQLYVSRECQQVIWALENWTGEDGDKGASKDFIDCLRYLALADLRHVTPGMFQVRGGGSY